MDNTTCKKPQTHQMLEYTTIHEAQAACLDDSTCSMVYDYKCDNVGYWTCSGTHKPSSAGSCAWTSNEANLLHEYNLKLLSSRYSCLLLYF